MIFLAFLWPLGAFFQEKKSQLNLCPQIREISPFLVKKGELWDTGAHDLTSSDVRQSDANKKQKREGEINRFFSA